MTDAPSFWALLGMYRGALAFDIGANIGQAAKVLAANFDRVVSFEPCEESAMILRAEHAPNVDVWPVAVSDRSGEIELDECAESIRTGQLTTGTALGWGEIVGSRWVESVTLDQAVEQVGAPDLVKVDTEGHELHVLRGGRGLISAKGTAFLIECHSQFNEAPIRKLFDGWHVERVSHDYLHGREADEHFYLRCEP